MCSKDNTVNRTCRTENLKRADVKNPLWTEYQVWLPRHYLQLFHWMLLLLHHTGEALRYSSTSLASLGYWKVCSGNEKNKWWENFTVYAWLTKIFILMLEMESGWEVTQSIHEMWLGIGKYFWNYWHFLPLQDSRYNCFYETDPFFLKFTID